MAEPVPGRVPLGFNPAQDRANINRPAPSVQPWGGAIPSIPASPQKRFAFLPEENIYRQLCSWNNLLLAYRRASKGKRGQANVAAFEHLLEDNLLHLHKELSSKTYSPGSYDSFYIHEPKRRLISAAPFRDRVVHHALCNLTEPIFERSFIADSYANRLGKGTHRALDRCQEFARRYRYVLQGDVEQFFPAIDHDILREILARKINDKDIFWLIDRIISSGQGLLAQAYKMRWFAGDDLFAFGRRRGLPIGNLTSQFWANCYLNPFDHFVKRKLRCSGYMRYVDDILLFSDDKRLLWEWKTTIIDYLTKLRLTIHPNAQPRPVKEGIPYLGFIVFPQQRRLKRRKGIYYRRRLKSLIKAHREGQVSQAVVMASVRGWLNHVRYGNTVGLRKAVLRSTLNPPTERR